MNIATGLPMNLWIKICVSFLLLSEVSLACSLNTKGIISLSGPVSTYLDQLKIVNDLEAISSFHPIKNFKGVKLAGGLYLSTSTLKSMEGKIVFFDKSRELKKVLERFPKIKSIELDSRRKTPREVIEQSAELLKPYLKNCDEEKSLLDKHVSQLETHIRSHSKKIRESIFFLGHISEKLPDTILSNDGFVYWLKKEGLMESYPTDLEYVNWSMKVISPLRGKFLFFGVEDSFSSGLMKVEKKAEKVFNVSYPGALTPGYTQLEFMKFLVDYF